MATDGSSDQAGLDRRQLIKRGALVAGAAWTAPMILDSVMSPVAAATGGVDQVGPQTGFLTVPANRPVAFELIGGGGGGGGQNSYCGGSGMQVSGTIAGVAGGYTLNWQAADGGGGGGSNAGEGDKSHGGTSGEGYKNGGAGGSVVTSEWSAGGGGGGGGATAIYSSTSDYVYAPGGGGSGGGAEDNPTGYGHGNPPTTPTNLNIEGANGLSTDTGGKGGSTSGPAVAGGTGYPNDGSQGTTTSGGDGGIGGPDGTGGGGGGGGFCGGGGGGGEDYVDPAGAGGNGSAVSAGFTFTVAPEGIAADTSTSDARTSGLASGTPGRCGDGTATPESSANGGKGGPGSVKLTFVS